MKIYFTQKFALKSNLPNIHKSAHSFMHQGSLQGIKFDKN